MFDKSLKERNKKRKKVVDEYKRAMKSRLYNGWDIINEEETIIEYKGARFKSEPEWILVVYDYAKGSIELSHREGLGFSTITLRDAKTDTLDLRFAKPEDHIELELDESIDTVCLNSVNIRYSYIQGDAKYKFDITKNTDIVDLAASLNFFIKNNHDVIESINLQGITNEVQLAILRGICEKNQLNKYSFNLPGDTDYKKGRSNIKRKN